MAIFGGFHTGRCPGCGRAGRVGLFLLFVVAGEIAVLECVSCRATMSFSLEEK